MRHESPLVKKAKQDKRLTVPHTIAIPFAVFEQMQQQATDERRSISNVGAMILEDHYIEKEKAA